MTLGDDLMIKLGFISSNKILVQSIAAVIKNNTDFAFETFALLNPSQAALDAAILELDIAVIDLAAGFFRTPDALWSFCKSIRQDVPACNTLLLVPQEDDEMRSLAMKAKKDEFAGDFVFADSSLDYLLTKLIACSKPRL